MWSHDFAAYCSKLSFDQLIFCCWTLFLFVGVILFLFKLCDDFCFVSQPDILGHSEEERCAGVFRHSLCVHTPQLYVVGGIWYAGCATASVGGHHQCSRLHDRNRIPYNLLNLCSEETSGKYIIICLRFLFSTTLSLFPFSFLLWCPQWSSSFTWREYYQWGVFSWMFDSFIALKVQSFLDSVLSMCISF